MAGVKGASGGRRRGAGRPRKTDAERLVAGNAGKVAARVLAHPSAADAPAPVVVDEFDAPDDLTTDERLVWLELAPHAFQLGTLTAASSLSFRVLCRNIVLERRYAQSVTDQGSSNHRGMIQRIEGGLDAFGLRPQGRAMPSAKPAEKPASKLSRFLANG
jgi:hypothetical protein